MLDFIAIYLLHGNAPLSYAHRAQEPFVVSESNHELLNGIIYIDGVTRAVQVLVPQKNQFIFTAKSLS
ncbi:hypothetical protein Metme_0431 [Methylomonas methanica MC09]|uniref:Uncharacterized protein n=1 Tax=Methylomonas methanica (strain DSM 25384 / MC09) TaxID=857087 RepID=G0A1I2_METMM|nr:hypothetical protein Metme_0431 [Methylomonas methanica MC09]